MILISSIVGINISNTIIGKIIIKKKYFKLFKFDKCNPINIVANIKLNNLIEDIIDSTTFIEYKVDKPAQIPKTININNGLFEITDLIISLSGFLKRKKNILKKLIMLRYNQ
tara:strand:- start:264 stop:599 length:336 start_codon:yes stop_codon:yes gene_type:complete